MRRLSTAIGTGLFLLLTGAAQAVGLDGTYECKANGDIPIGLITIAGDAYTFQATNASWAPVDDANNGAGVLTLVDTRIEPLDGPLLEAFAVYGQADGEVIVWYNGFGALMGCWPR